MTEDRGEVSGDGLMRLQSATADFARAEISRIVAAVIDDLRSRPANDTFGDVAARHLWDEYCWSLQEGPFDDEMGRDDVRLGSLSGAFDDLVRAAIQTEVEKCPKHALVFLSSQAFEENADGDEEEAVGSIWIDGIVSVVLDKVNTRASSRTLDLIGPHRGDVIGYEVEGSGKVWSVLSDRGEAINLIASHCDALLDPYDDLSDLAEAMVAAFIALAKAEMETSLFADFFGPFESDIGSLIREQDVLPALERMRAALLRRLDG